MKTLDFPPGTDHSSLLYPICPAGLTLIVVASAAALLPGGFLIAWALSIAGSMAVLLASEGGLDDFPSARATLALRGLGGAFLRGLLAAAFTAAPVLVVVLLDRLSAWVPGEEALAKVAELAAPIAFLAFFLTAHAYFPALLTAALDPDPLASLSRSHRRHLGGDLFVIRALAYGGLFALFFVRAATSLLPPPLGEVVFAATLTYLHLAFARLAVTASRGHRMAKGTA